MPRLKYMKPERWAVWCTKCERRTDAADGFVSACCGAPLANSQGGDVTPETMMTWLRDEAYARGGLVIRKKEQR